MPSRPPACVIRPEQPADIAAIHALTREAFLNAPHTDHTEHLIVDALREAGALSVSLVAEADGQIVGHIAFSPVSISDGSTHWFGLGPVSVLPACQGRGIGRQLVASGLERLRALGAAGCVVLGEPAYYGRFGFAADPTLVLKDVPPAYFQALAFTPLQASGEVAYHAAFTVRAGNDPA